MAKKKTVSDDVEEMLPEYDFSKGTRGVFADRFKGDCIAVVLDPDVAETFPTSEAANEALRGLAAIIKSNQSVSKKRTGGKSVAANHK